MITNLEICDKDCEVKRYMSSDTNTYMTICNNCIYSKKMDHYTPKKSMDQLYKEASFNGKCVFKIIDFFMKGSK